MNPLRKIFATPQEREIERRLALAAASRKVNELDRYCDERDRRIATKTAQAVEFKSHGNKSRGIAVLREVEDERRCLDLGLKVRRLAQKAQSRLELNRIGADAVMGILPLLDQAQRETDPRRIHEAMAQIDELDRRLDSWESVDAGETVDESARLEAAWETLGNGVAVSEAPTQDAAKGVSDAALAPLQERLRQVRERLSS